MTRIELRRVDFKESENFHGIGSSASLPYDTGIGNVRLALVPEALAIEVTWTAVSGSEVNPQFRGPALVPLDRVRRMYLPDAPALSSAAVTAIEEAEKVVDVAQAKASALVDVMPKRGPGRPPKNPQPADLVSKDE